MVLLFTHSGGSCDQGHYTMIVATKMVNQYCRAKSSRECRSHTRSSIQKDKHLAEEIAAKEARQDTNLDWVGIEGLQQGVMVDD